MIRSRAHDAQTLHGHLVARRLADAEAVVDAAARCRPLSDLLVELLEPAIYRAGVEVAQGLVAPGVEIATVELVRTLLVRLAARSAWCAPQARTVVTSPVPGEQHTLGLEMVTTLLARDGWRVRRLGAPSTADAILGALDDGPDLLCLSLTGVELLDPTGHLMVAARATSPGTKIMVGGLAARLVPERAVRLGADLFAEDARAALAVIRATFGRR